MDKKAFTIPNISCNHCVMAIKSELTEMEGIITVSGDPESKTIVVEWSAPTDTDSIREKLKEINYSAE